MRKNPLLRSQAQAVLDHIQGMLVCFLDCAVFWFLSSLDPPPAACPQPFLRCY